MTTVTAAAVMMAIVKAHRNVVLTEMDAAGVQSLEEEQTLLVRLEFKSKTFPGSSVG